MSEHPAVNSVPIVSAEPLLPFQLYETRPASITWHMIWDHELTKLVNISRPVTLGLSTLFVGSFVGLLPSLFDAVEKAWEGDPLSLASLTLCMIASLCLAAGVVCGFFAYRGQKDAEGICGDVRSRNLTAVSPPNQRGAGAA